MEDLRLSSKLDDDFLKAMVLFMQRDVKQNTAKLDKLEKVRVNLWTKKLCQATLNCVWKKNRNAYARLMRDMLVEGKLKAPFDRLPPQCDLPQMLSTSLKTLRPVTSFRPFTPKSFGTPKPKTYTKSEANLRVTASLASPRESVRLEVERLRLEGKLLADELNEAKLLSRTAKAQLTVCSMKRRDEIIRLQQEHIEQLRSDLGQHHCERLELTGKKLTFEPSGDSDFFSYLDSFHKETVRLIQAELKLETDALFSANSSI